MRLIRKIFIDLIALFFLLLFQNWPLYAQEHTDSGETSASHEQSHVVNGNVGHESDAHGSGEEFNAAEVILDHVKDSHEWHIITTRDGHHISIPLPVILYSKHSGMHVFMSNKLAHGHNHLGFEMGTGTMEVIGSNGEMVARDLTGKIVEVDSNGEIVDSGLPLDFSITKNVFMMFLAVMILIFVFLSLARSYKKHGVGPPKGLQGFLEPLIEFIEEDVAKPNMPHDKYKRFMPYLLTVFFFILIHNLMGLIPFFPFGANVTGNIAVTMVLATFTLVITNFNGNKGYWKHIFAPPGVPVWLLPIMIPVELLGIITKPFALMIRLFANITAGHIIILSLVSLIFIFKSVFMAVPSLVMVIFMDMIELLVAFLQAYIFTLLSALFIGLAMPAHHHDE